MMVCFVVSLESSQQGNSYEYTQYTTQYTIFNINKTITLNYPKSAAMCFFYNGIKNELETAMAKEPSVFQPLKVYCNIAWAKHFF